MIVACTCGKLKDGDTWTDIFLEYGYMDKKTVVSHGICPDCVKEMHPDMSETLLQEK